jgi:predicted nuclease with TOPRIM domain
MAAMKELAMTVTKITKKYDQRFKEQGAQTEALSTGLEKTQASLENLMAAIKEKIEEIETSLDENAKMSKDALETCEKQVKELEEKIELARTMMEEQIEIDVKANLANMGMESVDMASRSIFEGTLKKMKRKELEDKIFSLFRSIVHVALAL